MRIKKLKKILYYLVLIHSIIFTLSIIFYKHLKINHFNIIIPINISLIIIEVILLNYVYYNEIFRTNSNSTYNKGKFYKQIMDLKEIYNLIIQNIRNISQIRELIDKSNKILKQINEFPSIVSENDFYKFTKFNKYLQKNLKYVEMNLINIKKIEETINYKYKKQIKTAFKKLEKRKNQKVGIIIYIIKLIILNIITIIIIIYSLYILNYILIYNSLYYNSLYYIIFYCYFVIFIL